MKIAKLDTINIKKAKSMRSLFKKVGEKSDKSRTHGCDYSPWIRVTLVSKIPQLPEKRPAKAGQKKIFEFFRKSEHFTKNIFRHPKDFETEGRPLV